MKKVKLDKFGVNGKYIYTENEIPTSLTDLDDYSTIENLENNKQDNLTQEQLEAVDSGITANELQTIETNLNNALIDIQSISDTLEQSKIISTTVTLNANDWDAGYMYNLSIPSITTDSIITVSPVVTDPNFLDYINYGVAATSQYNGGLQFQTIVPQNPEHDLTVNIIIDNRPKAGAVQVGTILNINQVDNNIIQTGNTLIIM